MLLILLPLAMVACDDLPTEPSAEPAITATELGLRARVPSYTRGALLREALRTSGVEDGPAALWRSIAELRTQHAVARAARDAGDRAAQTSAESARRAAETTFIAAALDDARLDSVRQDVQDALEILRLRIVDARAAGRDVTRVDALAGEVAQLLDAPSVPLSRTRALARVLDAGDLVQQAQQLIDALTRVRTLDDLLSQVVAQVRQESGAEAARALLAQYQTFVREAEEAIASGDREHAHAQLKRLRAEQLRIIAGRLGMKGVATYVAEVDAAQQALVTRNRQQKALARQHTIQAVRALHEGRITEALERAVLAADLIGALPIRPI